jgi:DNA-binding NarL/FixJ family response regulator
VKALIVEDQPVLRESLAIALGARGVQVVAEAADVASALRAADRTAPDVVLLDVQLGKGDDIGGLRVARQLRHDYPTVGLLVLSAHDEPRYLEEILRLEAGPPRAVGYLVKDRGGVSAIVEAMTRVAAGDVVLDPVLVERLAMRPNPALRELLSPHEYRLLSLVAEGLSNHGVAERLNCKVSTVERHLTTIAGRLGVAPAQDTQRRTVNVRVLAVLAYLRGTV